MMLLLDGVSGSGLLIGLMLLSGGAIGVILDTGAIDDIVNWAIFKLKDKGVEVLLPVFFMMFGVLGGFGGGDQFIAFVPIGVVLAKKLRLDPIVACAAIFLSSYTGFATGPNKQMNTQLLMGVPIFSGFMLRFVWMLVCIAIACIFTTVYALKIKKDPSKSAMGNTDWLKNIDDNNDESAIIKDVNFNPRAFFVVLVFFAQYFVIVYLMSVKGQSQNILPAVLVLTSVISGLVYGMSFDKVGNSFAKGVASIAFICLIIGMAKTMSLVMDQGKIIQTIVYYATIPLKGFNKGFSAIGMSAIISVINFFIPSMSAKIALLVPIIKPIAETLNMPLNLAVSAFQYGDGFTNLITPFTAVCIGSAQVAGVPFHKWVKWALPVVLFLLFISFIQLYICGIVGWTGL